MLVPTAKQYVLFYFWEQAITNDCTSESACEPPGLDSDSLFGKGPHFLMLRKKYAIVLMDKSKLNHGRKDAPETNSTDGFYARLRAET